MFFVFSFFFIVFSIYLPFGCSMFGFLPTSERGQETPTSWPLLPCPEEFEEVGEEWIVGKIKNSGGCNRQVATVGSCNRRVTTVKRVSGGCNRQVATVNEKIVTDGLQLWVVVIGRNRQVATRLYLRFAEMSFRYSVYLMIALNL